MILVEVCLLMFIYKLINLCMLSWEVKVNKACRNGYVGFISRQHQPSGLTDTQIVDAKLQPLLISTITTFPANQRHNPSFYVGDLTFDFESEMCAASDASDTVPFLFLPGKLHFANRTDSVQ